MAALHEMAHNMGAVQDSAPHATTGSHCWDDDPDVANWGDVMCYDDGSPNWKSVNNCVNTRFDCGANDYFNPVPAPGSYLATHWNLGSAYNLNVIVTSQP